MRNVIRRVLKRVTGSEPGAALVSTLMLLVLMAGMTAGFTAMVISDTQVRRLDNTRTQAFYVAHAGLEKLTSDLGDLFAAIQAPTGAQIQALAAGAPGLGATWTEADGTDGYRISYPVDGSGNPVASVQTVTSGPYTGLVGMATQYQMTATARLADRTEASVTRTLQTVAIPVFQFGLFSENDLSFFAGPDFDFGGRVHTNGHVFMASGNGSTLTMTDPVSAYGEVVRTNLANGAPLGGSYSGNVSIANAPGSFRDLDFDEGSLIGTIGSAQNEPTWTNVSTGAYNSNLLNGRTGARRLDLPITSFGATPIDLVRRPPANENVTTPQIFTQRYFAMASLRILLSDTAANITSLPTVTATAPIPLGNLATTPVAGYTVGATKPPFAISPGTGTLGVRTPANTPLLGGFIKIEMQNNAGVWQDVTLEILNLGVAGKQWATPSTLLPVCAEPNPNAIIRIERLRDNGSCLNGSVNATDYVPNVLYDTREGVQRDKGSNKDGPHFGGIIHYIEIDARNLSRWFQGVIGTNGANALDVNGYTVYFSDRRGNRNAANLETGEYGFEDVVNPASSTGTPNGILDAGEDVNFNNVLDTYGQTPRLIAGMIAPLDNTARPWTTVDEAEVLTVTEEQMIARRNPAIFFRRALKLTNGGLGNLVAPGLTIASENPVYVQGNWNANALGFGDPHVSTAILADALTLLSNNWNDRVSFDSTHSHGIRLALDTWYRFGIIAGKSRSFPQPNGTDQDFGTDGGAHNFLRYLENWGGETLHYKGSIVSFYNSRQATGIYKCCDRVYSPPIRAYSFDTDFLTPSLLPPRTPMFRDVNITGFWPVIRPQ